MKNIFERFTLFIFASCFIFSCSDDKEDEGGQTVIHPVQTLSAPADGVSYDLLSEGAENIEFSWKKAEASVGITPQYEVVFIKENGDFNSPLEKIKAGNSGKDNKAKISHLQLDQIAAKANIGEGETGTLKWSVNTYSGSLKALATTSHKITVTRSAPFVVPSALYITGEATETGTDVAGSMEFTQLASGKFEIFTKLEASQNYRFIDSRNQNALRYFFAKDGKLEIGETYSKVNKSGIYRITVDFSSGEVTHTEVNNFRLVFCIDNNLNIPLKYDGNGTWKSAPHYLLFPNRDWGKEDRYKFKMNVTEGKDSKDLTWGSKIGTDGHPNGEDSYFYIKESFDTDMWADKWKFRTQQERKCVVATVSLQGGKEYTHSVEEASFDFDWASIADQGTKTLANNFWNSSAKHFYNNIKGQMRPFDYWPEAHALDVIIDAYERTGDATYKQRIYDFHDGIKAKNGGGFYNNFYDDMAWHGLTHMRAYNATGDIRYENSARALWGWLTDGWNDDDGGGIPWNHGSKEEDKSKGVPTNGPSAIIGVRRWVAYPTEIIGNENNLQWSKKLYAWIRDHRYVPETGRVFENINDKGGDWTYNAGTFMGAAMELYDVTKQQNYFDDAIKIADYGIENLSSDFYVLSDWAEQYNEEKDEDHDVNLFKAIFVRYFTRLIMHKDLPADKRQKYIGLMEDSAKCLWTRGTLITSNDITLFGHRWWEFPKKDTAVQLRTQTSGCAIMEAMALLQERGYLTK